MQLIIILLSAYDKLGFKTTLLKDGFRISLKDDARTTVVDTEGLLKNCDPHQKLDALERMLREVSWTKIDGKILKQLGRICS